MLAQGMATAAPTVPGVALVIGHANDSAPWQDVQEDPLQDARRLRQVLEGRNGFHIIHQENADLRAMEQALQTPKDTGPVLLFGPWCTSGTREGLVRPLPDPRGGRTCSSPAPPLATPPAASALTPALTSAIDAPRQPQEINTLLHGVRQQVVSAAAHWEGSPQKSGFASQPTHPVHLTPKGMRPLLTPPQRDPPGAAPERRSSTHRPTRRGNTILPGRTGGSLAPCGTPGAKIAKDDEERMEYARRQTDMNPYDRRPGEGVCLHSKLLRLNPRGCRWRPRAPPGPLSGAGA